MRVYRTSQHTQFESCFGDLFCWLYFGSFSLLVFRLVCSMNHTAFWCQSINCCARILALCELATHQPRRSICNWIGRWSLAAWYSVWLVVVNHLENWITQQWHSMSYQMVDHKSFFLIFFVFVFCFLSWKLKFILYNLNWNCETIQNQCSVLMSLVQPINGSICSIAKQQCWAQNKKMSTSCFVTGKY